MSMSEEQKIFINDMKLDNKTYKEIQQAFGEKYNRRVSNTTINRYSTYNQWGKPKTVDPDEKPDVVEPESKDEPKKEETKDEDGGVLEVKVEDSRKEKKPPRDEVIHFSDGEIEEEDFNKIVALRGTDNEETWEFLRKCGEKGYTKIDLKTGEISE